MSKRDIHIPALWYKFCTTCRDEVSRHKLVTAETSTNLYVGDFWVPIVGNLHGSYLEAIDE